MHDEPRRAVHRGPVAAEELLDRLRGPALGRAHERGVAAAAQRPPHAQPPRDGVLHGELLGRHRKPTPGRRVCPCRFYDARCALEVHVRARARVQRRAVDELGCRRVLGDVAHRLVDGDLGGRRAAAARGRPAPRRARSRPPDRGPRAPRSPRAAARTPGASRRTAAPLARAPGRARRPAARTPPTSRASPARRRRPTHRRGRRGRQADHVRALDRPRVGSRAARRRPDRAPRRGSTANDRTSGSIRRCARACTPEPTTASTDASSRASARVDSAAAAAVRSPVMCSPSISARQAPVVASNSADHRGVRLEAQRDVAREDPDELDATGLSARASGHREHRPAVGVAPTAAAAPRTRRTESACKPPETASSSAVGRRAAPRPRRATGSARPRRLLQV